MAEYAANSHVSETTKVSPFFANYGFTPRFGIEPHDTLKDSARNKDLDEKIAIEFSERMMVIHENLQHEMTWAQALYEKHVGREPSPAYQVGDMVWLNVKNIRTERLSKKLDFKNIGPFRISGVVNPRAYRLELPTTMKVHNVFHTSLLHPAARDPMPGQVQPPPPPVVVERERGEEDEWEVEAIQDSRVRYKKIQYLVKWKGYENVDWRSWKEVLPGCDEMVRGFHERYPEKPGPPMEYDFSTQGITELKDTEKRPRRSARR